MSKSRLIGGYLGPIKIRERLEAQTMGMARDAKSYLRKISNTTTVRPQRWLLPTQLSDMWQR